MQGIKSLVVAAAVFAATAASAVEPKTYQVTGEVVDVKGDVITVLKGKEKWEVATGGKSTADVKPGSKVTIEYRMTATSIEVKDAGKAAAKDAKPAGKPASKK